MPDKSGHYVDTFPHLQVQDGKLTSAPGEKLPDLPPGDYIVKVKVDGPSADKAPVTMTPILPDSTVYGVTQSSPPKPAAPGPPNGFQTGAQSPHQETLGRPVGVPPRSIFDFGKK